MADRTFRDMFGFAIQLGSGFTRHDFETLLNDIIQWASQDGGDVEDITRSNGFIDLTAIGAGELRKRDKVEARSRTNECPANQELFQYTKVAIPDLDLNKDLKWAGTCDPPA